MPQEQTADERQTPATERLDPPAESRPAEALVAPSSRRRLAGPLAWAIAIAALAIAGGAIFLLTRPGDPMSDPRPVEVVQGFASAIESRDASKMLSFVEPTVFRREISPEIRSYVEHLREARFENPRYQLLDSDGDVAHVRWTATMRYTLDLGSETRSGQRPIDTTFELLKIEGSWYLHAMKL